MGGEASTPLFVINGLSSPIESSAWFLSRRRKEELSAQDRLLIIIGPLRQRICHMSALSLLLVLSRRLSKLRLSSAFWFSTSPELADLLGRCRVSKHPLPWGLLIQRRVVFASCQEPHRSFLPSSCHSVPPTASLFWLSPFISPPEPAPSVQKMCFP